MASAEIRFHTELNRFLAPVQRERRFTHAFSRDASVKHLIEALGVPHTEVELIVVNGVSVDFTYRLRDRDCVEVYPHCVQANVAPRVPLRAAHGRRFVADAHLGQLARKLRMLGFDVLYRNDYSDSELARIAAEDGRIVLTRDRDLLIRREIVHGCYLHAIGGDDQLLEVMARYKLLPAARAFSRCLSCNGALRAVALQNVEHRVPPHSRALYREFFECDGCARVYWEGSHVASMRLHLAQVLDRVA
jgi:uncharacterized protein